VKRPEVKRRRRIGRRANRKAIVRPKDHAERAVNPRRANVAKVAGERRVENARKAGARTVAVREAEASVPMTGAAAIAGASKAPLKSTSRS
jgi:hypothetical protein